MNCYLLKYKDPNYNYAGLLNVIFTKIITGDDIVFFKEMFAGECPYCNKQHKDGSIYRLSEGLYRELSEYTGRGDLSSLVYSCELEQFIYDENWII